jgi:peptidyl-dipeptidase Dcp
MSKLRLDSAIVVAPLALAAAVSLFSSVEARDPVNSAPVPATAADNPFIAPSPLPLQSPQFDLIRDEHFRPAFLQAMQQQLAEIDQITAQTSAPTFQNTIDQFEKTGQMLTRVRNVFSNLTSSHKTEVLQQIETELAPLQAAHADNILLNPRLFARIQSLWDRRDSLNLSTEQSEVLRQHYETFVRAGAKLDSAQQARIRSLNEEISKL